MAEKRPLTDADESMQPAAKKARKEYYAVVCLEFDDDYKHRHGNLAAVKDVELFKTHEEAEQWIRSETLYRIREYVKERALEHEDESMLEYLDEAKEVIEEKLEEDYDDLKARVQYGEFIPCTFDYGIHRVEEPM